MEGELLTMRIGPQDTLTAGTLVRIGDKRGTVLSATERRDQFNGPIVVHKIRLTERKKVLLAGRHTWEAMKPKIVEPNYSFIEVV